LRLIENGYESNFLDFKKVQYRRETFLELIVDIMSMANSNYEGDKYIITGIKDKPSGEREIFGIKHEEFMDSSVYQNVVSDNIEPEIQFDYFPVEIEDKLIGVIKLSSCNNDRPYMLKKQYKGLNEGLCKIRKGSNNVFAMRKDIDTFISSKEFFEVKFMETTLMAVYEKEGYARTSITIRNITKNPVVINYGLLTVLNIEGKELSSHRVYGFDNKIVGADFSLSLSPMEEKLGNLFVGFESSDCFSLGVDKDGYTEEIFTFKLLLVDKYDNEYIATIENGKVFVRGNFLWKVQLKAKKSN
jgi:hypothetical protein